MDNPQLPLILASGSPRRKEILTTMGLSFRVEVSEADERFSGSPEEMVREVSYRKALAVASHHQEALVLAADTTVCAQGEALGKPLTAQRAAQMLAALSGRWHSVYTGLALINTKSGYTIRKTCETRVHFVEMTPAEIDAYIATGEPLDKAGAYGIQGRGGMFIDRIEGSYSNVVGLPMSVLRDMLAEMAEQG